MVSRKGGKGDVGRGLVCDAGQDGVLCSRGIEEPSVLKEVHVAVKDSSLHVSSDLGAAGIVKAKGGRGGLLPSVR